MQDHLLNLPGIRWWRKRRFDAAFAEGWAGSHRGIFETFDQARQSAPPTKPVGFDNAGPAAMYQEWHSRTRPSDYPVLFWLAEWLRAGARRVFDLGGHVGISYYAFGPYLRFDPGLRWTVLEVEATRRAGAALALERGVDAQLSFVSELSAASGADILLAAGSLQFIDGPGLGTSLRSLKERPRWVLINKTPLTPGKTFVTLQNASTAFVPCRITNADEFIADLTGAGYRLVDRWENADMGCLLPMEPERSVRCHSGLAFERTDPGP